MRYGKFVVAVGVLAVALSVVFLGGLSARGTMGSLDVGQPAPDFSATDSNGKTHKLSDLKGEYVVLEWLNHSCPFVRKHYDSGNMQETQAMVTATGATWLSVVSSAPGKEGYMTPEQTNAAIKKNGAHPAAVLLDPDGDLGKQYGARTTPHIFIIDPEGTLVYQGAIDSVRSTNQADIKGAKNYVSAAFASLSSSQPIEDADTAPYGCSVKYKD